jgi:hypothetical protein
MVDWTTNPAHQYANEIPPTILAGGMESFPALEASSGTGLPAIYPTVERLGLLDFSEIDPKLIDCLNQVSADLAEGKIDGSLCNPARPYLPIVTNYRFAKLPTGGAVLFGRPTMSDGESQGHAVFRIRYPKVSTELFVNVTLTLADGKWAIDEVTFDGASYAELARQD